MTDKITYEGSNQQRIAEAAARIVSTIKNSLPRVPWLSNSGQQEAFRDILSIITDEANEVYAETDARNAIIFWVLTVLYANKKSFRLATASIKNFGFAPTAVAKSFVSWVGTNSPPGEIVMNNIESWRNSDKLFQHNENELYIATGRRNIEEEMKKHGLLSVDESLPENVSDESRVTQVKATELRSFARYAYDEGWEMGESNWPGDESKIRQHSLTTVLLRRLQAEPDAPSVSQELIETLNFEAIPFAKLPAEDAKDAICEYIVWREYPVLANEQLIQKVIDALKAKGFVEDVLKGADKESLSWLAWSKLL